MPPYKHYVPQTKDPDKYISLEFNDTDSIYSINVDAISVYITSDKRDASLFLAQLRLWGCYISNG